MCGNLGISVASRMPASSGDPVSTALHMSLAGNKCSVLKNDLHSKIVASSRRILLSEVHYEKSGNYSNTVLDSLKSKYIVLNTNVSDKVEVKFKNVSKDSPLKETKKGKSDVCLPTPKKVLFSPDAIQLGWQGHTPIGAGMVNMGNTCYLNSTLQALFHIPAFVNWISSDKIHSSKCQSLNGYTHSECLICPMNKTLQYAQRSTGSPIKPVQIYSKLKLICKHLVHGHQEDAHEFLRYLIESMERSYLHIVGGTKLDSYSKETTPISQIFGGYLRTEVTCLECRHVSTTFQHFQDLLLDIRTVGSLEDALENYFGREQLGDGEEAYRCEQCHKRVAATKKFTVQKAPNVLCLQLKRFGIMGGKISKHISLQMNLDITRFMHHSSTNSGRLRYRLVSMISHIGPSSGCGHYTAMAASSSGQYFLFDDSMVRPVSTSGVSNTNAYVIMYELEPPSTSSPSSTIQRCTMPLTSPIATSNGLNGNILKNGESLFQSSPLSANNKTSLVSPTSTKTERASTSVQLSPSPKHYKLSNGSASPSKSLVPYTPNESSDSESENAPGHRASKQLGILQSSSPKEQKLGLVKVNGVCKDLQLKGQSLFSHAKSSPSKEAPPLSASPLKLSSVPSSSVCTLKFGSPCKTNNVKREKNISTSFGVQSTPSPSTLPSKKSDITHDAALSSSPLANGWHVTEASNHSSSSSATSSVGSSGLWNVTDATTHRTSETSETVTASVLSQSPPEQQRSLNNNDDINNTSNSCSSNGYRNGTGANGDVLNTSGGSSSFSSQSPSSNGKMWDGSRNNRSNLLLSLNHRGYGSASGVTTWSGGRSEIDKEVENDKAEQRKRAHNSSYDDELDRGKVKKVKNYSYSNKTAYSNGNGRYNPFQDHQNRKNSWHGNNDVWYFVIYK